MDPPHLTPSEVVELTGKRIAASQASWLAKRGIPFIFLGRSVQVLRVVAVAHGALPAAKRPAGGIDFSKVR